MKNCTIDNGVQFKRVDVDFYENIIEEDMSGGFAKIRNLTFRYMPNQMTLFPMETEQYVTNPGDFIPQKIETVLEASYKKEYKVRNLLAVLKKIVLLIRI